MLVSELIQYAYEDCAVVQVGETISTALQTSGFTRLNQLIASLSAEGATVFTETFQTFSIVFGTSAYTVGTAGTMPTAKRAQKITAWKAVNGSFVSGGAVLEFPAFEAAVQSLYQQFTTAMAPFNVAPAILAASGSTPLVVGADSAWPSINLRVYPAVGSTIELTYWTPIDQFAAVGDTVSLPPGYELLLRSNLAVQLWHMYERVGGLSPALAALAQNSKAVIIQQNVGPAPTQSQPQAAA